MPADRFTIAPACAGDAEAVLEADLRRVERLQAVYSVIYGWLDQGAGSLPGAKPDAARTLVRGAGQAGALLEGMRKSILREPSQAMRTHSRRGREGVGELLR